MYPKTILIYPPFNFVGMPPLGISYLKATLEHTFNWKVAVSDLNLELYQTFVDIALKGDTPADFIKSWNTGSHSYRRIAASLLFDSIKLDSFANELVDILKNKFDRWADDVSKQQPDFVGLSVTDSAFFSSIYLAREVKSKSPSTHITLGGPLMNSKFAPQYLNAFEFVDSIITGEGEKTIEMLCSALFMGQRDLNEVCGLTFRNGSLIKSNKSRPFIQNLDDIPYPDFSDFDLEMYTGRAYLDFIARPTLPILASRGCAWARCSFCSDHAIWQGYRCRDPGNVVEEMIYQSEKYSVFNFMFCDLALNGNRHLIDSLCEILIEEDRDFIWECMVRAGNADEKLIRKMSKAGCRLVYVGVESISKKILRSMKKGSTPLDNIKVLRYAIKNDIFVIFNLMSRYPEESLGDVEYTYRYLCENEDWLRGNSEIFISKCILTFGSDMFTYPQKYGISVGPSIHSSYILPGIDDSIPSFEHELINKKYTKKSMAEKEMFWKLIEKLLEKWNKDLRVNRKKTFYLDLKHFVSVLREQNFYILEGLARKLFLRISIAGEAGIKKDLILDSYPSRHHMMILRTLSELADLGLIYNTGCLYRCDIQRYFLEKKITHL